MALWALLEIPRVFLPELGFHFMNSEDPAVRDACLEPWEPSGPVRDLPRA